MQIQTRFDNWIETRDGVRLSAHVYRPEGEGRWPALVVRTPYNKNGAEACSHAVC